MRVVYQMSRKQKKKANRANSSMRYPIFLNFLYDIPNLELNSFPFFFFLEQRSESEKLKKIFLTL